MEIGVKSLTQKMNKEYEKIPIACQICKYFLEDDYFIEEFKTKFVCNFDDEISPKLLGKGCEEFEIGKWHLVEFLKRELGVKENGKRF